MRALVTISLFCALTLTGCKLPRATQSETAQINVTDLAVKHSYKLPKNSAQNRLRRFNDPQLHQLISVALIDAPDIRSAKARVMRAAQIARGTYSALWPSASLNGYIVEDRFSIQGKAPPPFNELIFNKASIADLALNFNYELDFWGKNRQNLASRLNETFAAQMDLEETQLILSSTVATSYFQLQNDIVQQQLAKENVRLLQELEHIVLDRAKQGIESDIPVKTAISNTQTARLSAQEYKRSELQSRHQLAVLLGKNPFNTEIETKQFNYNKKQLTLPDVLSSNILAQRPDIAASRALAEAAAHQIKVARAAFFPDINLSAILSLQSFYFSRFFNLSLQTEGVKAAFSLPIFDAGARRANLGVKHAEYELAVNQYNQTILNALQEVSDHMSALKILDEQIHDQTQSINTTAANYTLFHSSYSAGIIDYIQVLQIKQVLVQQKITLYSLQTRQKQAFVALLAALGGEVKI